MYSINIDFCQIEHTVIDLAANPHNRKKMLAKMPDTIKPPILVPQVKDTIFREPTF